MTKIYTTWGSVRGCCGHRHRTLKAAKRCLEKDQRACANLPGGNAYSDRHIRIADSGDTAVDRYTTTYGPGEPYQYPDDYPYDY